MVIPIEPDGRGGVRPARTSSTHWRPPGPAGKLARAATEAVGVDVASAGRVAGAIVTSVPRDAVLVAHLAAGMARVAGAQVDRASAGLGEALTDLLSGPGRAFESAISGGFWANDWATGGALGRLLRIGSLEDRARRRRVLGELMSDTAGAVWSSVWRRGA